MPEPNSKYQENLRLLNDPRIQSLLKTIRNAEGATYNTRVGGKTFDDLSKKPGVMTRLPKLGISSSAEGAYQFLNKTWNNVSKDLGIKDFSPLSQDIAAVELIRRRGALDNILRGDFKGGINKLSPEWASLPTASGKGYYSGQKARRIDDLEKIYTGQKVPKGTYESFTSPKSYSHSKNLDLNITPELDASPINLEALTVTYEEPEVEEAKQDILEKSFQEDLSKLISIQQEPEQIQQVQEFVPTDLSEAYNYIETDPGYNFQEFQKGGTYLGYDLPMNSPDILVPEEFTIDYIKSPKYRERLLRSGYKNVDEVIKDRINKVNTVNTVNQNGKPNAIEGIWNKLTNTPYSTQGSAYKADNNTIIMDSKTDNSKEILKGLDSRAVKAHELGHTELAGSNLNIKDQNELFDRQRSYNLNEGTTLKEREEIKAKGRKTDFSNVGHDWRPEENKSDLNALRFLLKEQGIYNAGKQEFTGEHLNKLKSNFIKDRLLKNYKKEDLIWLMNNVAQNDNSNEKVFFAQNGGATRRDSLNVYNNSRIVEKYYRTQKYKKQPTAYTPEDFDVHKENKSDYIEFSNREKGDRAYYVNNDGSTQVLSPSDPNIKEVPNSDYRKEIDKNRYLQREAQNFVINGGAPMQLFDRRIMPVSNVNYEKNGDKVRLYTYNSIANKPFDLLTDQEKKERVEKYGRSGVPESYGKNIPSKEAKRIEELPDLEKVNKLKQQGLVQFNDSSINSNINIPNQYLQPKYWDVQDTVNQNFGGSQTNYRVTPETAESMLRTLAPNPYNSRTTTPYFQTGGSIDESKAFLENWYPNRVLSDPKLNSDYQAEKQLYINQSQNLPDPNYVNQIDDFNTQGTYDSNTGQINLLNTASPSVYTHEATHGINLPLKNTQSNVNAFSIIGQNILPQDKIQNQWVKDNYQQISNYQEVIPRLNSYRQLHGLKPDQVITPELIQNNRDLYSKGKIPFEDNTDQLYKMFENEGLSNVLNKVVTNENSNTNYFAQEGGFIIEDDRGQWAHPGEVTKINSSDITMKGVDYPVLGIDNLGNKQMMYPEKEYKFPGDYVIEYPQNKKKNNRFK